MLESKLEEELKRRYDEEEMIFVNFKTYQQGTGEEAINLAKVCQQVEKKTSVKIIPLVQIVDLFRLTSQGFNVWGQHVDNINFGSHTGRILPQAVLPGQKAETAPGQALPEGGKPP